MLIQLVSTSSNCCSSEKFYFWSSDIQHWCDMLLYARIAARQYHDRRNVHNTPVHESINKICCNSCEKRSQKSDTCFLGSSHCGIKNFPSPQHWWDQPLTSNQVRNQLYMFLGFSCNTLWKWLWKPKVICSFKTYWKDTFSVFSAKEYFDENL